MLNQLRRRKTRDGRYDVVGHGLHSLLGLRQAAAFSLRCGFTPRAELASKRAQPRFAPEAAHVAVLATTVNLAVAISMLRGMIDLHRFARSQRSGWQGRLRDALRLVQNDRSVVNAGDNVDTCDRLYARDVDDAIDMLLIAGPIHIFVLGDIFHALHGLIFVAGVDLCGQRSLTNTKDSACASAKARRTGRQRAAAQNPGTE